MQHSAQQAIEKKKIYLIGLLLFVLISLGIQTEINAQGISSGVTFNWLDTQTTFDDPATLDFIEIDGAIYNTFVVPSTYEMTRLGPGGHSGNRIWENGTQIVGASNASNWESEAIKAYQSINLNHYFESNSNGDTFCGNFDKALTTDSQIQTINYSPGIPSNPDGILAVTERGGNNCQYLELYGIRNGESTESLLGRTFVMSSGDLRGIKPQAPPIGNSDYWSSGRNNENDQIIGIALFKLSDIAPVGSTITSIRYLSASNDNGDGKFFLMQTYAVDDIFDSEFDETFNGDVGANDNVPVGSSYSYFTSASPLNGTVVVNADGTFSYTPNPGFVGTDVFEVEVCLPAPNEAVCNTSTVTLTVKPDNLPTAIDDNYTIDEGTTNNAFNVLSNDDFGLDGPQENTALTILSNPTNGTAYVNNNGTPTNPLDDFIEYTPDAYYSGSDSLTYEITDANGTVATANVDITVELDTSYNLAITVQSLTVPEDIGLAVLTIGIEGTYRPGATINYSTSNVSAIAGEDYSSVSETYTLATENITSFDILIPITDDNLIEPSESFLVNFAYDTPAVSATASVSVSITDNDNGADKGVSINDFTVNEDVGTASFTVSLNGNVQNSFTVDYDLLDGSATEAEDYTGSSGTITFNGTDGELYVINVPIIDDSIIEETENLEGKLSNLSTTLINIVDANGVGTITDNDGGAGIGVSVSDFTVDENAGTATFNVSLNADVQGGFNVDFDIADGSAISPDDYTVASASGTLNFAGNNGEVRTVTVNIIDDTLIEGAEDMNITLSNLTSTLINIVDANGVGTITDNDGGAGTGVSVSDFTVDENAGTATFDVSLNADVQGGFNVDFDIADGSAISPDDYTVASASGTLNFAGNNGEVRTVTVNIIDDTLIEGSEDLSITLSNISTTLINIVDANGVGTITDNDGGAGTGVSVSDFTVDENAGTATFDVSLNADVQGGFNVDFDIADGSAISPDDYTVASASGTLNFAGNNGEVRTVTVNIIDDTLIEGAEDLSITLSNISTTLINIVDANGVGTITDNDGGAGTGVSVSDFTVDENAGTATFDVSLNADVQGGFNVDFDIADGSAISPDDYTVASASGTLNFAGNNGEVRTVTVNIIDDTLIEGAEDLSITLSNISTTLINIVDANGVGTITDNDGGAGTGVSVSDFTVDENAGTATFDVSLNADVQGGFNVDFDIADGSAISPDDYTVASASGTLNFAGNNGEVRTVTVNIIDDTLIEGAEDLSITLSNISTTLINIVDANGVGTITDNDGGAGTGVSVSDFTVDENAGTATFDVSLNADVQGGFNVDFDIADGSAISPDDYTVASASGTLNFAGNNGEVRTVTVNIIDDTLIEGAEDMNITLSNLSTTLINIVDANGVGTITDNDGGAGTGVSVSDFTVDENAGTATFDVSLNADVQGGFNVDFDIADGSAISPDDYTVASASGTLNFAGNNGEVRTVTVNIIDDTLIEGSEDLSITLSNLTSTLINIVDANGVGTITDNDGGAGTGVSVSDFTVDENAGTATFNVSLNADVQGGFNVDFDIADGSAISPDDYTVAIASGTLNFAGNNGEVRTVTVNIIDDTLIEGSEDLSITLSNLTSTLINIVDTNGVGTITDNDGGAGTGIFFDNTDVTVNEGDGTATFNVRFVGNFPTPFTVSYSSNDGTATNTQDYTGVSDILTFSGVDGQILPITVPIIDDTVIETTEDFNINLINVSSSLIAINTAQARGRIIDNDAVVGTGVSFTNNNVIVTEGTDSFARFTVTLTGNIEENVTVDYVTNNGTALDGADITAQSGTITFTSSANSFDIDIPLINDVIIEPQEAFTVVLSNIQSTIGIGFVNGNTSNTANGIINDDDAVAKNGLSFVNTSVEVTEGVGVTATFEVALTGNFQDAFDASFETAFGTATDTDFEAQTGNISFTGADGEVQTIVVTILDDNIIEPTESYTVILTGTTNPLVTINTPQANGTILDDDLMVTDGLSFVNTDVEVTEGVGVTATFEVALTGNFQDAFDVSFETAFGTATDTDFEAQTGNISFTGADGEVQTIVVTILDDNIIEPTESYTVILTGTTNPLVTINTPQANGTILDDDNDPSLGLQFDVTSVDIDEAAGTVSLNVVLNANVQDEFTVEYHTEDILAMDIFDYTGIASGSQTLTFGGANPNTQTIVIPIIDDIIIESTEDFNVILSNITTTLVSVLANDTAIVNIIDNDGNEGWPEDVTIEACDTIPPPADITSTSDCAISVVLNEVIEGQDDECATEYTITRTWTITDCVGNIREHIQVITIEDTVAPSFVEALPQDITVACNEVPEADVLTALDSCEPDIEVTFLEIVSNDANCALGYTVTRTWTASDCAGNTVDHTQIITIPPTGPIVAGPYEEEITILCGDVVPDAPVLNFTGGCGDYEIVFNEEIENSSDSDDFMIIRTWDVTDSCDNTASFEQLIFVLQPQLQEVTIDICVEEEAINLLDYLPEGFDANGEFMVLEGAVTINGSMFDPLDHQPDEYKIAYTSLGGECKYYVDFTIIVNTDCVPCGRDEIEISKAITPNGDGVNDTFEIRGVEFCQFTFDVVLFNRWGNKVAEVMDYQNTWGGEAPDGSFGSSGMLPAGTYYYIIYATDTETGNKLEPLNGFIYLGSN